MIRFSCHRCNTILSAPEDCVGRTSRCRCGQRVVVPNKAPRGGLLIRLSLAFCLFVIIGGLIWLLAFSGIIKQNKPLSDHNRTAGGIKSPQMDQITGYFYEHGEPNRSILISDHPISREPRILQAQQLAEQTLEELTECFYKEKTAFINNLRPNQAILVIGTKKNGQVYDCTILPKQRR